MGWFCTTSFGGDAFQMGSVESFFTLLLSSLHLALSLTAWWSLSLSISLYLSHSLCGCMQAVTHSCTHTATFVIRLSQGNTCTCAYKHIYRTDTDVHANACTHIPRCSYSHVQTHIELHVVCLLHISTRQHIHGNTVGSTHSNIQTHVYIYVLQRSPSLKYSSKCWCWTPALATHW